MTDTIMVTKKYLRSLSRPRLSKWISYNFNNLIGGATFTIGKTPIVPIIQHFTKKYSKSNFTPAHTGSIIACGGLLYVFNMTPPKSNIVELMDYILSDTDEDFRIIYRGENFELDTKAYSEYLHTKVGQKYGYLSALECISPLRKILFNFSEHCSEIHVKALQRQGYFKNIKADDICPSELYEIMILGDF